jgi:hypothetical protein
MAVSMILMVFWALVACSFIASISEKDTLSIFRAYVSDWPTPSVFIPQPYLIPPFLSFFTLALKMETVCFSKHWHQPTVLHHTKIQNTSNVIH